MPARTGCCSYTVRCYDADGETLWVQDFFKGASAASDPDTTLVVAVVGGYVFAAGPRMASAANPSVFFNCCQYDQSTGELIARHDLWSGVARSGFNSDIQDICKGDDGKLGVLWRRTSNTGTQSQQGARYNPSTMAQEAVWTDTMAATARRIRCEMDSTGILHTLPIGVGGRTGLVIEGSTHDYESGGIQAIGSPWYDATGRIIKAPKSNYVFPFVAGPGQTAVYHTLATRGTGFGGSGGSGVDTANMLTDIGVMRDSGGTAIDFVVTGGGLKRGATASSDIFFPPGGGTPAYYATSGSLAESGNVGRFSLSGTFSKTYAPDARPTISRVATINGAGYVLGVANLLSYPTLYMRDASDNHVWAHRHQPLEDVVTTPSGGCVTVGQRSYRPTEDNFVTP